MANRSSRCDIRCPAAQLSSPFAFPQTRSAPCHPWILGIITLWRVVHALPVGTQSSAAARQPPCPFIRQRVASSRPRAGPLGAIIDFRGCLFLQTKRLSGSGGDTRSGSHSGRGGVLTLPHDPLTALTPGHWRAGPCRPPRRRHATSAKDHGGVRPGRLESSTGPRRGNACVHRPAALAAPRN